MSESDHQHWQIIDAIPTLAWSARPDGSADFFNLRWLEYTGLSREQALDRGWKAAIHPDDLPHILEIFQDALNFGRPFEAEGRLRRSDGEFRRFLIRGNPQLDGARKVVRWYGTNTDLEDQKRTQDALRVSEARWRTILENSTVGIALTDMEGRFEITNEVYQDLLGYSEEEMRQITFLEVTAPEFREPNWRMVGEILDGKRHQFDIEKQYRRKDGNLVWVRNNVLVVPGADGRPRHIMAVVDNISARKRAEESLRASEERWRSVFDNTAVGIALVDSAENYVATNSAYQKMLGYSEKELQKLSYEIVTHEEDVEISRTLFRQLVEEQYQQLHVEKRCRRKDGTVVWTKTSVSRVLGVEGRTGLFAAVVEDITERKRAEEALRRSEAYLAEAQRLTRTGSCAIDGKSRETVYWSDEMFRLFDLDPQHGPPVWDKFLQQIHPEDRDAVRLANERTFHAKVNCNVEFRLLKPDGTVKHIHGIGKPVLSPSGELVQVLGTMVDVTERKRADEERERLREAHRVVVETASDAVVSADESGAIQFANLATTRVFGYDPRELIGKPLTVLMPESRRKLHENGFRRYLTTSQRHLNWQATEFVGLRKSGQEFPVEISFGELKLNEHRIFTAFIRDITERKQAEEERERLRRVQADLAHLTRVSTAGELTASLAHEIKQPIGAAVTNAEACLRFIDRQEPDLPEAREAALEMIKDARRAADIVTRVRSLYQKGSSQLETVNLNQIIDEMVSMMGAEANRHAVIIHTDLAQMLPELMADRVQLQQVMMNLMLNALEAMSGAGGELKIKSQLAPDDQLRISVSDTGVGVPAENMDKIFNAFFTTKTRGTGLGLVITRSIIELHGGRIWATANSGAGTTFHFTLPIKGNAAR